MRTLLAALGVAFAVAAHAAPADRLLKLAREGGPVDPGYVARDVVALLGAMKASGELRDRFDRVGTMKVRRLMPGERLDSAGGEIVVARGDAYIRTASDAVVIAANDVEIEQGGDVIVIAGGNIRFRQYRMAPWAGVFIARGSLEAPWLSHAAVAAGRGAVLQHMSRDILLYNTPVPRAGFYTLESRSGPPLFDGMRADAAPPRRSVSNEKLQYAGEQCAPPMTLAEIAPVHEMAKRKLQCGVVDDAIVTCDAKTGESLWTLHGCTNWVTEVIARRKDGQVQIAFAPPPPARSGGAVMVPPKPIAPGECDNANPSDRCRFARLMNPEPAPKFSCPEPAYAPTTHVDQLASRFLTGVGGSASKVGETETASFFELSAPIRVVRVDWSGLADGVEDPAPFVIRIFGDANGIPGALVKDWNVDAHLQLAAEVKFPPRFGGVYLFHANLGAFDLPAGKYWISILEPLSQRFRFAWTSEREGREACGSGGAQRKSNRDAWAAIRPELKPRSARGYSFSLTTLP